MALLQYLADWIKENPGKAIGSIVGFIIGVFIFTLGVTKTLLIFLFVVTGYAIGKCKDDNLPIVDRIRQFFKKRE